VRITDNDTDADADTDTDTDTDTTHIIDLMGPGARSCLATGRANLRRKRRPWASICNFHS
jgi:hypothetical protein